MKTFIRSLTLGALTLGLALIAPNLATAQIVESGPYWTAAASTCTPDKYNNNNKHGFLRSDFFFDGSAVGVILARCNVTNPLDGNCHKTASSRGGHSLRWLPAILSILCFSKPSHRCKRQR